MPGKTRLVPGSGILMDQAFVHGFVDDGNSRVQKLGTHILIRPGNCSAKLLDLCAELASVAAVVFVALCRLPYAF